MSFNGSVNPPKYQFQQQDFIEKISFARQSASQPGFDFLIVPKVVIVDERKFENSRIKPFSQIPNAQNSKIHPSLLKFNNPQPSNSKLVAPTDRLIHLNNDARILNPPINNNLNPSNSNAQNYDIYQKPNSFQNPEKANNQNYSMNNSKANFQPYQNGSNAMINPNSQYGEKDPINIINFGQTPTFNDLVKNPSKSGVFFPENVQPLKNSQTALNQSKNPTTMIKNEQTGFFQTPNNKMSNSFTNNKNIGPNNNRQTNQKLSQSPQMTSDYNSHLIARKISEKYFKKNVFKIIIDRKRFESTNVSNRRKCKHF